MFLAKNVVCKSYKLLYVLQLLSDSQQFLLLQRRNAALVEKLLEVLKVVKRAGEVLLLINSSPITSS